MSPVLTDQILAPGLRASIDRAITDLPAASRGSFSVGASLTGVEASVAQRGPFGVLFGAYAGRLWGGGWQAGARATKSW